MKKHLFNRKYRILYVLVGICICILATSIASWAVISDSQRKAENSDKDNLIRSYIAYLANINTSIQTWNNASFYCETPGMGTESSTLPDMTLEEAEASNYLSSKRQKTMDIAASYNYNNSIAMQQHDLIVSQFGDDAWDHVSYTAEEIEPVDGSLGYKVIATGELVSEEEYNQILKKYWVDVAKSEGISYDDLFLSENEPIENMRNKRVDILNKYFENIPVKLVIVSDSQTYKISLAFDGESVSKEGFKDFHFVIDNRKGSWNVFQGLTWTEPFPEYPERD